VRGVVMCVGQGGAVRVRVGVRDTVRVRVWVTVRATDGAMIRVMIRARPLLNAWCSRVCEIGRSCQG
jgi:hypothetical protein